MSVQQPSQSIFQKRWKKFTRLKRGYYSFWVLIILYLLSFALPVLVNNKALVVYYEGNFFFPVVNYYSAETFDQPYFGEAHYRELAGTIQSDGWVIMPLYPYHPNESLLNEISGQPPTSPSKIHFFGTDNRARDVFARLLYGFNISVSFGIIVTFLSYCLGILFGAILGYFGGKIDIFGQRFIEIFASLPFLYTMIIISSLLQPHFVLLVCLLTVFSWTAMTYYVRGEFYREKGRDYALAAVSIGASPFRVMFKHILPNALTPIITFAPFAVIGNIGSLVALDFLGFGLAPPTPSWGELVNQGISDIRYWWLIAAPMVATFLTLLCITFVGEAIREAFDPKPYSRLK